MAVFVCAKIFDLRGIYFYVIKCTNRRERERKREPCECHSRVFNTFLVRIPVNIDIILEHSAYIDNSKRTLATFASRLHVVRYFAQNLLLYFTSDYSH